MTDLMNLFDELDRETCSSEPKDSKILRAPFGYPGGKTKSVPNIIKYLPYKSVYIEPFGGSGAVLLARKPVKLEVLNDRYAGIIAFYRCLRHPEKYKQLIDYLDLTLHSREDFVDAKQTWCTETDDVVRAAKWYYMTVYSFSQIGRNFGRALVPRGTLSGKISNKLKYFSLLHERLKKVQIENQDWRECIRDYDSSDTVFYIDPPYIDAYSGTYQNELEKKDHYDLINIIFSLKGFVALSGYSNPLYENQAWDSRHSWESFVSIDPRSFTEGNHKEGFEYLTKRERAEEVLWIKEIH